MAKKNGEKQDRILVEKIDGDTEYAIIIKPVGGGKFLLRKNMQATEMIGKLCGRMRRGKNKRENNVVMGSVVLVGLRDFEDGVVDIIHVYTPQEVRQLKKADVLVFDMGEEDQNKDDDDDIVIFTEDAFNFEEI